MRFVRLSLFCLIVCVIAFMPGKLKETFASYEQQEIQKCIVLSDALDIPDDGSWLQICLADPSASEGATVTETNVKILIDHRDTSQLELRLTRTDSDINLLLPPDAITKEGIGEFTSIHDFDGLPSQGEWIFQVRDTLPGTKGRMKSASAAFLYSSSEKMPLANSDDDGKPTSERIAIGAQKISSERFENSNEEKITNDSPDLLLDAGYSVPIMSQSFEGAFPPSTGWSIYDANPNDGKEYYWDDDNLKPYTGSWGTWPARGGANGIDPISTTTYPTNMDTWMIYGPFDLSNAKSAEITFMLWRHIELNFDHLFFGISGNGTNFSGWSWDGSANWENKTYSLNSYLGDSDVWVGWHFTSDASVQYEGPWIDDIMLKFEPGDIAVQGNFTYADRSSVMRGANAIKVQLWDSDSSGNDLMAEAIADSNGHYSFPPLMNWDLDDADPNLGNRRLDLYVRWVLENNDFRVTNTGGTSYAWISSTTNNISMGNSTISGTLPDGWTKFQAMWFFQDIRRVREYYLSHTNPQVDPGFMTAHWEENQNSENGIQGSHFWALIDPHVYIAHDSRLSPDTIVHELGHHLMWNKTGQWLWYEFNCFDHQIFSQESTQCAWSEGWADYFAITVNGDACYDFDEGPCTGQADVRHFDLEKHTRNDNAQQFPWGDGVEGRVAGTLYDLFDAGNEAPWYDNASWGFDPIVDIALVGSGKTNLLEFWDGYQGNDKHNGVRSIYQNTIDYNQAPVFTSIPEQRILQNFPRAHLLDLWAFSSDVESPDGSLTYQLVSVSDSRCGISLDSHWINANPQMNWTGSCYVTVRANDSIKTTNGSFWIHILPINSRIFLPVIMNN